MNNSIKNIINKYYNLRFKKVDINILRENDNFIIYKGTYYIIQYDTLYVNNAFVCGGNVCSIRRRNNILYVLTYNEILKYNLDNDPFLTNSLLIANYSQNNFSLPPTNFILAVNKHEDVFILGIETPKILVLYNDGRKKIITGNFVILSENKLYKTDDYMSITIYDIDYPDTIYDVVKYDWLWMYENVIKKGNILYELH